MFHIGHLGGNQHPGLLFNTLEPFEPFRTHPFECIGPGTGFPYASPENLDPHFGQGNSRIHHLLLSLSTAWASHNNGFRENISIKGQGFQFNIYYHNTYLFNF